MKTSCKATRIVPLSALVLFLSCTGAVSSAFAQTITVTAANPNSAPPGTVSLNVTVSGNGFKKGAAAKWFVTGTTNPGGVTVNSTAFVSSSQLTANITVAQDAAISKFDIQVTNADGRTGKGTELFAVAPYNPQIVYDVVGKNAIAFNVSNADGTDAVSLYSTSVVQAFKFAPTGNRIVFATDYDIKVLTYAVSSQGVTTTGVSTLTIEPYRPWGVDVSPDGTELLFVEDTATPNQRAVFVMSMSGGTPPIQILLPPGDGNYSAVWANSNSRIAVLGIPVGQGSGVQTIQIVDLDPTNNYAVLGTPTTIFTSTSQLYFVTRIESAHTSDTLVFNASSGTNVDVYTIDIGTGVVSAPIVAGSSASFSADDSTILFIGPTAAYFYEYNLDTGVETLINSSKGIREPDFLP